MTYLQLVQRGQERHGDKFSEADLVEKFRHYFVTGERIKVRDSSGWERTGTVGVTTGWRPAFLLMHRSNAIGPWDVLSASDEVIAVQRGRRYVEV